jgi:aspartate racemase
METAFMGHVDSKIIGVIGGCGPQAGILLADHVFRQTKATTDQEHLPLLLSSIPGKITDRTAYILGHTSENPADALAELILQLEISGASVVGIACNTAHSPVIFDRIRDILLAKNSAVKLLHIVEETIEFLSLHFNHAKRIGVLCTEGSYKTRLYEDFLKQHGFEFIDPGEKFQREFIHRCVYDPLFGVKACSSPVSTQARQLLKKIIAYYRSEGADALILGCTEYSIMITDDSIREIPVIDSTKVLARALVREACVNKLVEYTFNSNRLPVQQ